jgi:hypothetical protein
MDVGVALENATASLMTHAANALLNDASQRQQMHAPPFPPPPAPLTFQVETTAVEFIAFVLSFVCFFVALTDIVETEDFESFIRCGDFEYASIPVYNFFALCLYFAVYGLKFLNLMSSNSAAHAFLSNVAVVCIVKNELRKNECSRRQGLMITTFVMFQCVLNAMLQSQHVYVDHCRSLLVIMIVIGFLPIMHALRLHRRNESGGDFRKLVLLLIVVCVANTVTLEVDSCAISNSARERSNIQSLLDSVFILFTQRRFL